MARGSTRRSSGRRTSETYTDTSDLAAGGRIAFDAGGHVYFSVGMKAPLEFMGIQDLSLPYGKIHRVRTTGASRRTTLSYNTPGALKSIWTYGHRSVQGLEFEHATRQVVEHGDGAPGRRRTEPPAAGTKLRLAAVHQWRELRRAARWTWPGP